MRQKVLKRKRDLPELRSTRYLGGHASGNGNREEGNGGEASKGPRRDTSIRGQESTHITGSLAKVNFAIRGIDSDYIGRENH